MPHKVVTKKAEGRHQRAMGVRMTHTGSLLRQPGRLVHALTDRLTSETDLFIVTHMGLAEVDPVGWRLSPDGLVAHPCELTLAALDDLPKVEVTPVHECAGSPLTPTMPKRRVGNSRWTEALGSRHDVYGRPPRVR